MKYLAGTKEIASGAYFSSVEGLKEAGGYTKEEICALLRQEGFSEIRFYYPFPDYRFAMSIYSDDYLPKQGELIDQIGNFDSDIITIDYRVRGFTRDVNGKKLFMENTMTSIQDYIDPKTLNRYDAMDINVYQANIFHTKMLIKEMELQNYLFNTDSYELPPRQRLEISDNLRREMIEIFSGMNIYGEK